MESIRKRTLPGADAKLWAKPLGAGCAGAFWILPVSLWACHAPGGLNQVMGLVGKKRKTKPSRAQRKRQNQEPPEQVAKHAYHSGEFQKACRVLESVGESERTPEMATLLQESRVAWCVQLLDEKNANRAEAVLERLEGAGTHDCRLLRLRSHLQRESFDAAWPVAAALANETPVDPFVRDTVITLLASPEDARIADLAEGERDVARAIIQAMRHLSARAFEAVNREIKTIPKRSIFAPWRLYLRGARAFYELKFEAARQSFEALAGMGGSLEQAAARHLEAMDLPHCPTGVSREQAESIAPILGFSPKEAKALARAEYLWRRHRPADLYRELKKELPEFPVFGAGLSATLTRYFTNQANGLPPRAIARLYDFLIQLLDRKPRCGDVEAFFTIQTITNLEETSGEISRFPGYANRLIASYEQIFGPSARARSFVQQRIGQLFARASNDLFSGYLEESSRQEAIAHFKQAIEEDPANLDATLALLDLYENERDYSARNRLLDNATKAFPENKDILRRAGCECKERKALVKALTFLREANRLDPLDAGIKDEFMDAAIMRIDQLLTKKKLDPARKLFFEIEPLFRDDPDAIWGARDVEWVRQAVLEDLRLPDTEDRLDLELAFPSHPVRRYFAACVIALGQSSRARADQDPYLDKLKHAAREADNAERTAGAPFMLRMIADNWGQSLGWGSFLQWALAYLMRIDWAAVPAPKVAGLLARTHEFSEPFRTTLERVKSAYLQMETPPAAIRLLRVGRTGDFSMEDPVPELQSIAEQARAEEDLSTAEAAEDEIRRAEQRKRRSDGFDFDDEFDDEDDDEDDFDFEDDEDGADEGLEALSETLAQAKLAAGDLFDNPKNASMAGFKLFCQRVGMEDSPTTRLLFGILCSGAGYRPPFPPPGIPF